MQSFAQAKQLLSGIVGANRQSELLLEQFAQALAGEPFRKGVMGGLTVGEIFSELSFPGAHSVELSLDLLQPGMEKEFTAYTIPNCGYLPSRTVEGDYITVPTYPIGNQIDWCLSHQAASNYNFFNRVLEVFRDGFSVKISDDGWHLLLAAGLSRGIIAQDSLATAGYFTKRLVSIMKVAMRRNGGGNSGSMNRSRLTDMWVSPEALEGMRNWGVDQADDITRREIYLSTEDGANVFGVNIHPLDELGVGKEYQLYYENDLSGTVPPGKQEMVVGLDLSREDSFLMPVSQPLQVFPDNSGLRQLKAGVLGWMRLGMVVVDTRRVILGAL